MLQTDVREQLSRSAPALRDGDTRLGQGQLDILLGGENRQEMKALEDEAEAGETEPGEVSIIQSVQTDSQQLHGAAGRDIDTADQLEQGRLSAA
jgi:hypothetical protein